MDEQIRDQIDTNLLGPIHVTRSAIPYLRAQGGGRILGLSTYGGQETHAGASLYHASKWGLEGFMESMSQELAPFNIGITIIEPGGARTGFRGVASGKIGARVGAYQGTPAGMVHTIPQDIPRLPNGDRAKMVRRMIECVDQSPAPRRLVLGSDAYQAITKALAERAVEIEAQKDTAPLTDISAPMHDSRRTAKDRPLSARS